MKLPAFEKNLLAQYNQKQISQWCRNLSALYTVLFEHTPEYKSTIYKRYYDLAEIYKQEPFLLEIKRLYQKLSALPQFVPENIAFVNTNWKWIDAQVDFEYRRPSLVYFLGGT